jgi:hypothetical protein
MDIAHTRVESEITCRAGAAQTDRRVQHRLPLGSYATAAAAAGIQPRQICFVIVNSSLSRPLIPHDRSRH